MNLFELYRPLAREAGEAAGVPYLLQPEFPLWMANTAFGYSEAAVPELRRRFDGAGAPLAFTLPERFDASALLASGFRAVAAFEVCATQPSKRSYWTEHVPWSEAWNLSRVLTEAYGAPEWRFAFAQGVGKLLQKPETSAFVYYLYGDAVGAVLTHKGVAILAGVVPQKLGNGAGEGLAGRVHPTPLLRLAGTETEFPGAAAERFVRYSLE